MGLIAPFRPDDILKIARDTLLSSNVNPEHLIPSGHVQKLLLPIRNKKMMGLK